MKKNQKIILILCILLGIVLIAFGVYNFIIKNNDKKEEPAKQEETEQVDPYEPIEPETNIADKVDEDTQKLLDSIALYVSIYGGELNDEAIYYTLMHHIEKTATKQGDGWYTYTIPKETLIKDLAFINKSKNINDILAYQNGNYNQYDLEEDGDNYVLLVGGHGNPSNEVILQEGKVKQGVYTLSYLASCADSNDPSKHFNIGMVEITLDYNEETKEFSLANTVLHKSVDNYSCYWS